VTVQREGSRSTKESSVVFKKLGRAIAWIIEGCGALVAAAGVVLLYLSFLAWLKSGVWPAYDLQMLWDEMQRRVEWKSAQRIIEMAPTVLLRLPLWIAFLIIGAGVIALGCRQAPFTHGWRQFGAKFTASRAPIVAAHIVLSSRPRRCPALWPQG